MIKVRSHEITYALSNRNCDELFLTEVKTGPSTMSETLRFDALSIKKSWTKPCITGYEVKVSRSDFLHDDKFIHYKNYCHRLYMVCPKDLIAPSELPEDIGLIYYNPEKKTLHTKRIAHLRDIEISFSLLYYILVSRISNDIHPFFNETKDYIEAYLLDKADRNKLAYKFKSKLIENVVRAETETENLKRELEKSIEKSNERDELVKILRDKGLLTSWDYRNIETLRENLGRKYPKELCDAIKDIDSAMEKLNNIILKYELIL